MMLDILGHMTSWLFNRSAGIGSEGGGGVRRKEGWRRWSWVAEKAEVSLYSCISVSLFSCIPVSLYIRIQWLLFISSSSPHYPPTSRVQAAGFSSNIQFSLRLAGFVKKGWTD